MAEEVKEEIKTTETTVEQKDNLAEQALKAAAELREQVDAMKAENKKAQELFALQQLGGKTEAGSIPEPVKEETPAEYAKRVMENRL